MKKILLHIVCILSMCFISAQNWTNISQNYGISDVQSVEYYPGLGYVVACIDGIYKYENNMFFSIPLIQTNYIYKMQKAGSKLYFSTSEGLYIWEQGMPTKHLTVSDGLKSNDVYFTAESGGNLLIIQEDWISYYDGVHFQHYYFLNTMSSFNQPSACPANQNGVFYYKHGKHLMLVDNNGIDTISTFDHKINDLTLNPLSNQLLILTQYSIYLKHFNQYIQLYYSSVVGYVDLSGFSYLSQSNSIIFTLNLTGSRTALYCLNLNSNELRYGGFIQSEVNEIYISNSTVFLCTDDGLYMNDVSIFENELITVLDHGNFSAMFTQAGRFFWDGSENILTHPNVHLNFPQNEEKITVFASQIWLGGFNQMNQLCVAAETFSQQGRDFFAGPVSDVYDSQYDNKYSRIWKIKRTEILNHINSFQSPGYTIPDNFLTWPAFGDVMQGQAPYLAPFFDNNQNGIYDPVNGDYPLIPGEQAVYMIFNDDRYDHTETQGQKTGIEIHAIAYVVNVHNDTVFNDVLFVKYLLFNRKSNDFDQLYLGHWADIDIGYAYDDFMGCDTVLNCFFGYNGKEIDGWDTIGHYLHNPPVQGITFLSHTMSSFVLYYNISNPGMGNPNVFYQYYNLLTGKKIDGTNYINPNTNQPTYFVFPGDPNDPNIWNESSAGNEVYDRRGLGTVGPIDLQSGSDFCLDLAYVYNRDCLDTSACVGFANYPGFVEKTEHVREFFDLTGYGCPMSNTTLVINPAPPYTDYQSVAAYVYNDQLDYQAPVDDLILISVSDLGPDKVTTSWQIVQGNKANIEINDVVFNVPGNSRALLYLNLHHNPDEERMETYTFKYFSWGLTGMDENTKPMLSVYPNPANEFLIVNLDPRSELPIELTLIDVSGRVIDSHLMLSCHQTIDVSHIPGGIYILSVKDSAGNRSQTRLMLY